MAQSIILIGSLLFLLCFTLSQQNQQSLSPVQEIIASRLNKTPFRIASGLNKFANELYGYIAKNEETNGNLILSPFSIHTALSMLYFGSPEESETHREMTELLGLPIDYYSDYAYNYLRILLRYENIGNKTKTNVQFANKLFVADNFEPKQNFNDLLQIFFLTSAESINFLQSNEAAKKINKFIEDKTNGLIKDMLDSSSLNERTRLVLINAIYFKAKWLNKFDKKSTRIALWRIPGRENAKIPRKFMITKARVGVAKIPELKATVLELPYEDKQFRMLIVVPKKGVDVRTVEERINQERFNFTNIDQRFTYDLTHFGIPKFTTNLSLSLNKVLSSLGAKTVFSLGLANLTDISSNPKEELYVSEISHQSKIIVNEEGSEAAAATTVLIGTRTVSIKQPRTFVADRPFIYIIQDVSLKVPLFMGRLVDPENIEILPDIITRPIRSNTAKIGQRSLNIKSSLNLPDCDKIAKAKTVKNNQRIIFPCNKKTDVTKS